MAGDDDYEVTLNRILSKLRVKELPDLIRAMRQGINAEMKPKYGDTVPAFKGSQLLSFLSSQGLKQPDERMFLARELLSRGYVAHVPAGSKQPHILDFHDGNRYRFTQKDSNHARIRRSMQPGVEITMHDVYAAANAAAAPQGAPNPSPRSAPPASPTTPTGSTVPPNLAFQHVRGQIKPTAKGDAAPPRGLLLSAARATPYANSRSRGATETSDGDVTSPPTSPISRSPAISAVPRPVPSISDSSSASTPSPTGSAALASRSTTSLVVGTPPESEELRRKKEKERKDRKEKKERDRKEKEQKEQKRKESLTKDFESPRPSRAPLPPPRFVEKPVHINPPSARSQNVAPPPPLGEVLIKGEQEYIKVLQAGYKAFIEPLSREKLFSPQEVRYVAGNITAIIALHEGITQKLKDGAPPETAVSAVAGAIPAYLLYIANLTASLELVEDARNEPKFQQYATQQATVANCTFETFLQLPQRHLQFYLRLRSLYSNVIPPATAEMLLAGQKTLEERTKPGVDSRVWDLQQRLAGPNADQQAPLPRGPLSLDGVFERRDKPKLKHLALFLFPDRLLCASVSDIPHYRIKELLSLQDLEVVDLPDAAGGRKYALRITRQQKVNAAPLLVCFPSEEDKAVWVEALPGVRRMLRVPLEL